MTWKLNEQAFNKDSLLVNESLFAIGNGYLGVRGNFEEGYGDGMASIRGTYINAFHDITEIEYGEKLHGFPETQQKLLNVIDAQTVDIYLDGERFSLFDGEVLTFKRNLHFDQGFAERVIHWKSPKGKELRLRIRRLTSFETKELFAQEFVLEAVNGDIEECQVVSQVNGDVSNYVNPNDPRVASGHAKRLDVTTVRHEEGLTIISDKTYESELEVACVTATSVDLNQYEFSADVDRTGVVRETYSFQLLGGEPVQFVKKNVYTDTLRHGEKVVDAAVKLIQSLDGKGFEDHLAGQKQYLDEFWSKADIEIDGDVSLQEGIRFNLFQLLQSAGKDSVSNIAAKGLSGEGYEGHYFWDTEIYMFPVFLMTAPHIARNLLLHRYSLLDWAKHRAKEVGHTKGALFPWRTITGTECSAFFPAGTAQYHISADIAYSFIQYYLVTKDLEFLQEYSAEVLFETARLWMDAGHYGPDGKFRIDSVTGPDEYTCIVNNNFYTNAMAKHNLYWAWKAAVLLKEAGEDALEKLALKVGMADDEADDWLRASQTMFLPYNEELGIHEQDDTFLQKAVWDFENTPKENYPLLLHYHPLTLYRYQVCKQADTVLAHFLLEDEAELETIRKSYDYYEKVTTHDSSLSYCVFSIMASKLGEKEKAYNYFIETARLDLDNTHGNTKDGLHMANMGGTWLAIVFGFAGVRVKEAGLSLAPQLPEQWNKITFHLHYENSTIKITMDKDVVRYQLVEGERVSFSHFGEKVTLAAGEEAVLTSK
ncbi:MAG: family 65 glycosyl hydrolase [Bacillus sp. (in: Bacteria)]|nr:family 65 glycosyl hydrolase [Bacillus sp. (in: firmicutes)]